MSEYIGKGLDKWITGHYGEDQAQDDYEIEDDGLSAIASAMLYLKPRADACEDDTDADALAWDILQDARWRILDSYKCGYYCRPIARRQDKFCSKSCHDAARDY